MKNEDKDILMPEPAARTTSADGEFYWHGHLSSQESRFGANLYTENQVRSLISEISSQAIEVHRDAERYRWLKATTNFVTNSRGDRIDVRGMPDAWDEVIDRQRAASAAKVA